ncbi:MAG TPA: ferritin-like domain-containing protein [Kitasatospora aureofaciens]|uniref:ferritin-like domain-containing protein n=1 Tax=Kitasatospora aureofaciens TaxID=1894 RepID=UPI001D43BB55|nr:ferritin-like domain-containing protein [Kitasatospora aureofaciens]HJD81722.1 ferritin-like domain-containing protein [Kitasatospora aureofaciens]
MQPPSRRTFLALGLITLTTACTGTDGTDAATKAPAPDPDAPVRLRAVAATDALLSAYDALLGAPGARTALLHPLRAETAQHRAALARGIPAASGTPTPGAPTTAPSTTPTPTTSAALATLERQTAQSHLADLDAARPPLARLLASIAAANALHATTLGAPPDQPDPATTPIPSPSATAPSATSPGTALPALQQALSAEHAAVYGYGVVGAHLPDDQQRADARTYYAAHQAQRDAWQRLLTTLGTTPTPAAGGYQLPFPVTDVPTATKLAAHLETRLTTVYADLVADLPTPHRRTAATALRDCTLRAQRWGAPTTPFPGLPDPAPTPTVTPS